MTRFTKLEVGIIVAISVVILGTFLTSRIVAEQSGSSPDSETDSVLKDTYNSLVGLGYGSEEGSEGAIWNRIISSAEWTDNSIYYTGFNFSNEYSTFKNKTTNIRGRCVLRYVD